MARISEVALECIWIFFGGAAIFLFVAFFWNVYRAEGCRISGASVTLLLAAMYATSMCIVKPEQLVILGNKFDIKEVATEVQETAEKVENAKKRTELAANVALEASAIQKWNFMRLPSAKDLSRNQKSSKDMLKSIYGDEYEARVKRLIDKGYLMSPKDKVQEAYKAFGIESSVKGSSVPSYSETWSDQVK